MKINTKIILLIGALMVIMCLFVCVVGIAIYITNQVGSKQFDQNDFHKLDNAKYTFYYHRSWQEEGAASTTTTSKTPKRRKFVLKDEKQQVIAKLEFSEISTSDNGEPYTLKGCFDRTTEMFGRDRADFIKKIDTDYVYGCYDNFFQAYDGMMQEGLMLGPKVNTDTQNLTNYIIKLQYKEELSATQIDNLRQSLLQFEIKEKISKESKSVDNPVKTEARFNVPDQDVCKQISEQQLSSVMKSEYKFVNETQRYSSLIFNEPRAVLPFPQTFTSTECVFEDTKNPNTLTIKVYAQPDQQFSAFRIWDGMKESLSSIYRPVDNYGEEAQENGSSFWVLTRYGFVIVTVNGVGDGLSDIALRPYSQGVMEVVLRSYGVWSK